MDLMKMKLRMILFTVAILSAFIASGVWAEPQKIFSAIDANSSNCKVVSQKIFDFKELGQQEFKSSALLMEELRKLGFKVEGDLKVPADLVKDGIARTAFRAELQGKGPGPTITIVLEYDALKNGHSCGHNLIATSGLPDAAGSEEGWKATVVAAKVIALTAYDLLTNQSKMKAIQEKFRELKAKEGK